MRSSVIYLIIFDSFLLARDIVSLLDSLA